MTANSGGLYPVLPAAPLALEACASLVKPVVGSLLCAAVPRGAAAAIALLPVPLWPLVKKKEHTSGQTRHHLDLRRNNHGLLQENVVRMAKGPFNATYPSLYVQQPQLVVRRETRENTASAGTEGDLVTTGPPKNVTLCLSQLCEHARRTRLAYFNRRTARLPTVICRNSHLLWPEAS